MPLAERQGFVDGKEVGSKKTESDDLLQMIKWLNDAENSTAETDYREESVEDYDFYAGKQDDNEIIDALEALNRPVSVFNEIKPKIDMLVGLAAQMRYQPTVLPVGVEDEALAELMGGTLEHFRKKAKVRRCELECFEHTVKSGRSLLYFYVNTRNPFRPQLMAKRFPGNMFYVDGDSLEYDLSDARYLFLEKWMTEEEAKSYWKNFDAGLAPQSKTTETPAFFDETKEKYRIVEGWYYKYEDVVWFMNPLTNKPEKLPPSDYKKFVEAVRTEYPDIGEPLAVESVDKVPHYMIFCGTNELESGRSPYRFEGFPAVLYAAYRYYSKNSWFGAVKPMKDQQRTVNTQRRQLVHLLQTLPKGLLLHEVGAILNIEEYETKSAEPNFHLEVARGMIDKIRFEKQPQISPIYQQVDAMCIQGMKDSSGIQDSLMGLQTSSREPGVTVRMRQESGLAVLYTLFDNFNESRLNGDKILMSMIQQYVTEQTVIRIQGNAGARLVEINSVNNPQSEGFNDVSAGEFDLVLDEEVETATTRMAVAQILNDFSTNNPGVIPPDVLLDYSKVPYSVKERVREHWEQMQEKAAEKENREYKLELARLSIEKGKLNQSNKEKKGEE
jgi:hypothetical protein